MNHRNTCTLRIWPSAALLLASLVTGFGQPVLQFTGSTTTVSESAGSVSLPVHRLGDLDSAVTVDYATANGTAVAGTKYTASSGTLMFAVGERERLVVVPILNNAFIEGPKLFRVILGNPTGGAILGVRTTATVSISDNDSGISFDVGSYAVAENAGAVLVGVLRGDDANVPVTVDLATADVTAVSGVDYAGTTNTLVFGSTERFKWISIPILNNPRPQGSRSFRLILRNPTGASPGSTTSATVRINDNDLGIRFELISYVAGEDAGAVLLTVLRGTGQTDGTTTVDYGTIDGTAIAGVRYRATKGTVFFAPGESTKKIAVPILNNGLKDGTQTFGVALSNPSGGILGNLSTATVRVLDNDPGIGFERTRYTNNWGEASATLTVLRGNDLDLGPFSVEFMTTDGTARAGQDFIAVSGKLEFRESETVKTLSIPLLRNRATSSSKSFTVTLSNPSGGAMLGAATATVAIGGSYFPIAPPFDAELTIRPTEGVHVLSWNGGGQLRRADWATGPWQTVANAKSPYPIQPAMRSGFYRVTAPRPVNLYVPSSYDGKAPMPLVLLLHWWTSTGQKQEDYMKFQPLAQSKGFLYCYPDGLTDHWGQYWNATDACCDYEYTEVDDVGYLRSLIEEIGRRFTVDRKRIYLIGHSNGAFMAHRMACESANLIAGIASLAGTPFVDSERSVPAALVNILQIQGTADTDVRYEGGAYVMNPINTPPFPGAIRTIQIWAGYNGASDPVTDAAPSLDLVANLTGLDTVVTRYTKCPPGGAVELWTINGGSHIPSLSTEFAPKVIEWLLAHSKP